MLELGRELLYCLDEIVSVAEEVSMGTKGQHVVPSGGKWRVVKAGAARASGTYKTQREAMDHAKRLAQSQESELYVHGRDGRIRERRSYGRDPFPPKG